MKYRYILLIGFVFSLAGITKLNAQDLNAKVTVNGSQIQGVDVNVFKTLEKSLTEFLNDRKWTDYSFKINERIECTFTFILSSMPEANTYSGELQITAKRPVFNSSYTTQSFVFRDSDITFGYTQGENIEYNESNITSNLVAIVAFYTNVILGLDFDSFSLNGGKPFFERAMNIANASQQLSTKGWTAFDSDYNRYALALALTEESSSKFHAMWYTYHRLGLDEMSTNALRGKDRIIAAMPNLQEIYSARPSSPLISFFGEAKLAELADIYSEATQEERKEAYELFRKLYPSKTTQLNLFKEKR